MFFQILCRICNKCWNRPKYGHFGQNLDFSLFWWIFVFKRLWRLESAWTKIFFSISKVLCLRIIAYKWFGNRPKIDDNMDPPLKRIRIWPNLEVWEGKFENLQNLNFRGKKFIFLENKWDLERKLDVFSNFVPNLQQMLKLAKIWPV